MICFFINSMNASPSCDFNLEFKIKIMNTSTRILCFAFVFFGIFPQIHGQTTHQVHLSVSQPPELFAFAGNDNAVPNGTPVILGGAPTASGGTTPYQFAWSPNVAGLSSVSDSNPTFTGGTPLTDVDFQLLVTDARNCTAIDSVRITLLYISIEGFSENDLKIYPIPASAQLNIELPKIGGVLQILNADGRLLESLEVDDTSVHINVEKLARGVYTLIYQHEDQRVVRKLILQ